MKTLRNYISFNKEEKNKINQFILFSVANTIGFLIAINYLPKINSSILINEKIIIITMFLFLSISTLGIIFYITKGLLNKQRRRLILKASNSKCFSKSNNF